MNCSRSPETPDATKARTPSHTGCRSRIRLASQMSPPSHQPDMAVFSSRCSDMNSKIRSGAHSRSHKADHEAHTSTESRSRYSFTESVTKRSTKWISLPEAATKLLRRLRLRHVRMKRLRLKNALSDGEADNGAAG